MKANLTEMSNATVKFVSLVKRGANRIPFRIIKSQKESDMIDLTNPARFLQGTAAIKSEVVVPAKSRVIGVVVNGTDDAAQMERVMTAISAAGYSTANVVKNDDGTLMFNQEDALKDETPSAIVRMSPDTVLVVKGFSPYTDAMYASEVFNDVVATQGFYQGVRIATDALATVINNIVQHVDVAETDNLSDAEELALALTQFGAYINTLVSALPKAAFKMDLAISEAMVTPEVETPAPEVVVDPALAEVAKSEEVPAVVVVEKTAEVEVPAITPEVVAPTEAAPVVAEAETVAKTEMSAMLEAITKLTELVTAVKADNATLQSQVDLIARKAEDTSNVIKSTVIGSANGDDTITVQKGSAEVDSDPRTGCFDTAFLPKKR